MTELPPEAAALIAQARKAHGPKQADRERVLMGLHASLGIGAASALAAASATASAAESAALTHAASTGNAVLGWKSALLTWKAGKVVLATMALGGAIGVGAVSRGPHSADDAGRRSVRSAVSTPARPAALTNRPLADAQQAVEPVRQEPAAITAAAEVAPTAAAAQDPKRAAEPAAVVAAPAAAALAEPPVRLEAGAKSGASARSARRHGMEARTSERRAASKAVSATPTVASPHVAAAIEEATSPVAANPAQPNAESELAAVPAAPKTDTELTLIRRALTSLRDHDSEQALAVLAEHASRYPSGAFATERRGLRIVALCAAGLLDQGQREQAAFLQEAGSSPIAERVRRACSEDGR